VWPGIATTSELKPDGMMPALFYDLRQKRMSAMTGLCLDSHKHASRAGQRQVSEERIKDSTRLSLTSFLVLNKSNFRRLFS
jgi:hypothetical protein